MNENEDSRVESDDFDDFSLPEIVRQQATPGDMVMIESVTQQIARTKERKLDLCRRMDETVARLKESRKEIIERLSKRLLRDNLAARTKSAADILGEQEIIRRSAVQRIGGGTRIDQ